MDLPQLFASRKPWAGSTRVMAARAEAAGYPISHARLGDYARGAFSAVPNERTLRAIAAALFGDEWPNAVDEVRAAAIKSVAPEALDGVDTQYAIAFLRILGDRTEEEKRQLVGAVEAIARAMNASRDAAETSSNEAG